MRRGASRSVIVLVVALVAVASLPGVPSAAASTPPGSLGRGPTADYVDAAHRLFLGRSASAPEVDLWSVRVHRDGRPALTAALAASDEWAGRKIDQLYRQVLGRPADADGRSYWVARIAAGLRYEDVAAYFYGGLEYWRVSGSTAAGFVRQLYRDLLGRTADSGGLHYWVGELHDGLARSGVAAEFFASVESRTARVKTLYHDILRRAPDAGGLSYWMAQLLSLGDVALAAHLAASAEYHRRATGVAPAEVRIAAVGPGTPYPLGSSWRAGCPVHHRDLRAVVFPHWTDGGAQRQGVLVVHRDAAAAIAFVARTMHGTAFPLTSARPVDDFGGDDDRSMAADNSSAFNCRRVAGTSTWSQHAYGTAVDLNPERNPHVSGGTVSPPGGAAWLDRAHIRPGMVVEGGSVVRAFDLLGWGWGGRWSSVKDYQHFSANGR